MNLPWYGWLILGTPWTTVVLIWIVRLIYGPLDRKKKRFWC